MRLFHGSLPEKTVHGLAELLKAGTIGGIVNFGSCGNIRGAVFERNQIIIAKQLMKNDVLVTAHGCSGMGLLFAGFAHPEASVLCGDGLRAVVGEKGIPPVLHVGACTRQYESESDHGLYGKRRRAIQSHHAGCHGRS